MAIAHLQALVSADTFRIRVGARAKQTGPESVAAVRRYAHAHPAATLAEVADVMAVEFSFVLTLIGGRR